MGFLSKIAEKWRKWDSTRGYSCDVCGREVFSYPRKRLCDDCEKGLQRNDGLVCEKCGRKTVAEGVCLGCKQELPVFTRGASPLVYGGSGSALVNRLKNGDRRLAWFLGEEMAKRLLQVLPKADGVLIVPVPLTKERERDRGYNQAEALAVAVTEYLREQGLEAEADREILVKRKETPPQKNLSFYERLQNVSGAYHVHKRAACREKTVVLIDDVCTTGATGSECAARLFGAGAKEVYFLSAASLPERKG